MHANWNAEKAKEEIKHGGRFGAKRVREAVYRDNIDVFRQWGYTLPDGTFVGLGDRDALLSGTKVYARPFDVNKLPCEVVADQFRRVFAEPEFKGKFRALVFAILEKRPTAVHPTEDQGKFAPFYKHFGRWE